MKTTSKSSTSPERPGVPLHEVRDYSRVRCMLAPDGLTDFDEPHDLRETKPCLLGAWNMPRIEPTFTHKVEDRPP